MTPEDHVAAHENRDDALAAYALGALDPHDRPVLEAHLSTCAECRAELAALRRVTVGIGLEVEAVAPPPDLSARVIARATHQPVAFAPRVERPQRIVSTPRSTAWWFATAAAVTLMVAGGAYAVHLGVELRSERRQIAALEGRMAVLNAPDVRLITLAGQPDAPSATGRAYLSASRGLVFTANRLPVLPAGRVYQLWVVTAKAPVSLGLLSLSSDGAATTGAIASDALATPVAFAVTIEPDGGVPAPTGAKVLVGAVTPQ
jgi:anti-sigma-K factor RskA